MILKECSVENFGSYASLEIDFSNKGLCLIYGPTGAGKSTLPDIPAWILYGVTAKNGNADEVRSWQSPNEPTKGVLNVQLPNGSITVTRIRGKQTENDLYWEDGNSGPIRGKDITDTQKLLEERLGVNAELYLLGAYFHEFSGAAAFFQAKAKDRRQVFEKIANLSFAISIGGKAQDERKLAKKDLVACNQDYSKLEGRVAELEKSIDSISEYREAWRAKQDDLIEGLKACSENFDKLKNSKIEVLSTKAKRFEDSAKREMSIIAAKIEKLDKEDKIAKPKCPTCGANNALFELRKTLVQNLENVGLSANPYEAQIEQAMAETNEYSKRINEENGKINPFYRQLETTEKSWNAANSELAEAILSKKALEGRISSLNQLYDLSLALKTELLRKAINDIQSNTNKYLEKYFDNEIKVGFGLGGADDLLILIQKSGYDCVYTQLSKGQRGMLRLCFVLSVMETAANNNGVNFAQVFLDESLDGLDSDLKIKAFSLLEDFATNHESIFCIDHSEEFKSMFSTKYKVALEGDHSTVSLDE